MRFVARFAVVAALAAGLSPTLPAAAVEPDDLLTTADLPERYKSAKADPYADVLNALAASECALGLPAPKARALFVTTDEYALDVESLTEEVAVPGAAEARRIVGAAAKLPERCAKFETERYTIFIKAASQQAEHTTLNITFWVKAAGSQTTWVDVMEAEVALVAHRDMTVAVVLLGFYPKHAADLGTVTRAAVRRLGYAGSRTPR
jgi:hypothetical protein